MENNEQIRTNVSFAALTPYIESNIIAPTEKVQSGRDWVEWGDRNSYPDYLLELSKTTPTLRSIINGTTDFIAGDDISIMPLEGTSYQPGIMNTRGNNIREQVRRAARDYETYGGFALEVVRSASGAVVEIYNINLHFLRSNKDNNVFYYSENWDKSRRSVLEYPAFMQISQERWNMLQPEERARHFNSILFVKNDNTQTYPLPLYCAAVKDCEIERCISDYHLNSINNGFTSSMIINFNNGVPTDEIRREIEHMFNEKFSGYQNAGRIMFSWNENKDNGVTITEPKVEDFGDKYQALAKHCRQQIFTAFRANPNLFGIPTESLGFSEEEYESAFKLYNRTMVRPVQRRIAEAYERIYGRPDVITITPFSLEADSEKKVN